jgi:hypothetical protein
MEWIWECSFSLYFVKIFEKCWYFFYFWDTVA